MGAVESKGLITHYLRYSPHLDRSYTAEDEVKQDETVICWARRLYRQNLTYCPVDTLQVIGRLAHWLLWENLSEYFSQIYLELSDFLAVHSTNGDYDGFAH
jgi:hypothetical protein